MSRPFNHSLFIGGSLFHCAFILGALQILTGCQNTGRDVEPKTAASATPMTRVAPTSRLAPPDKRPKAQSLKAQPLKAQPLKAQPLKAQSLKAQSLKAQSLKAQPLKAKPLKAQTLTPSPTAKQKTALLMVQKQAATWAQKQRQKNLRAYASGYGVLICEPGIQISSSLSSQKVAWENFGAGCARWLQLEVGGQSAFGKTPLWKETEIASRALGKTNFRYTTEDIADLPRALGITHAVTGRIDVKTAQDTTLTLRLWQLPTLDSSENSGQNNGEARPVGLPLVVRGTKRSIARSLPQIALALCRRLNLSSAAIEQKIPDATKLEVCGRSFSPAAPAVERGEKKNLLALRRWIKTSRLAQTLWLAYAPAAQARFAARVRRDESNTLLLQLASEYSKETQQRAEQLAEQNPYNYVLTQRSSAPAQNQHALRCAPHNAQAWLRWAKSKSESVKAGKTQSNAALYAALEATRGMPRSPEAWLFVSRAAYRSKNTEVAEITFWKSLRLNKRSPETLRWGRWFFRQRKNQTALVQLAQISKRQAL